MALGIDYWAIKAFLTRTSFTYSFSRCYFPQNHTGWFLNTKTKAAATLDQKLMLEFKIQILTSNFDIQGGSINFNLWSQIK